MITQPLVYINYNCKPYALGKYKFELLIGHVAGKRKTKKAYKTNTPRGLTRNLNMAKMRPGEKLKVDFNMNGQPIGDHRATLANYCGALVKDPLNAPLYEVEQFSQIPQENKDKMWQLVLDKFDIGLDDDQEEEERKKKYMLKSDYYDTEETDEDRLKEENMPNFVDKKDWEWLVKYFGSEEFQKKSQRNIKNRSCLDAGHTAGSKSFAQKAEDMYKRDKVMPGLLDVYEETHLTSDKLPVTQMASDALVSHLSILISLHCCPATLHCCPEALHCCPVLLPCSLHCCQLKSVLLQACKFFWNEMKRLLEQRKAGEISLTDEEIYAKIKPKGKRNSRDRHIGVSPSITSLFGGFSECEKLRKEADKAMNEAAEAKKEAISANEQNKILTKKLKDVERENKVTRHFLEKFLNTIGYNLSDFNMDEDFEESNEEYDNEEDKDEEEISGNDRRLE
ncbi:Autonomous transposable element EN-1 mosaic protein [Bienertia sinuspersici]